MRIGIDGIQSPFKAFFLRKMIAGFLNAKGRNAPFRKISSPGMPLTQVTPREMGASPAQRRELRLVCLAECGTPAPPSKQLKARGSCVR
jgi:hypothetical protein